MELSESDMHLQVSKAFREEKGFTLTQLLQEYPNQHWKKSTVKDFLKKTTVYTRI